MNFAIGCKPDCIGRIVVVFDGLDPVGYIKVIKDYNINFEIDKLKKEMSNTTDPLIKASIGLKIVELKKEYGGVI